jgi:hypothetical protein
MPGAAAGVRAGCASLRRPADGLNTGGGGTERRKLAPGGGARGALVGKVEPLSSVAPALGRALTGVWLAASGAAEKPGAVRLGPAGAPCGAVRGVGTGLRTSSTGFGASHTTASPPQRVHPSRLRADAQGE